MRWNRCRKWYAATPGLLFLSGCLVNPWAGPGPGPGAGPRRATATADTPASIRQVSVDEPASRQAAETAQHLADSRDESKTLAARVQDMQAIIDEKTRALEAARNEVRLVSAEVARTREEIDHWRHEVASLRERAEKAEKDNQNSLKALIQLLEMIEKESSTPARPPALSVPSPPAAGAGS